MICIYCKKLISKKEISNEDVVYASLETNPTKTTGWHDNCFLDDPDQPLSIKLSIINSYPMPTVKPAKIEALKLIDL